MNVPNALTVFRFFLIPVFVVLYFDGQLFTSYAVVLLAGLTDLLDGYWARRFGQITPAGELLDPLADKSFMLTVMLSLVIDGKIPVAAAVLIVLRDVIMIAIGWNFYKRGKRTAKANWMGKVTTVLYYIAISALFFHDYIPYSIEFLWVVIFFSIVTAIWYGIQVARLNRPAV